VKIYVTLNAKIESLVLVSDVKQDRFCCVFRVASTAGGRILDNVNSAAGSEPCLKDDVKIANVK